MPRCLLFLKTPKNKMKHSQISFEFIVLFTIVLFVFLTFTSIFFKVVQNTSFTKELGKDLANDIKIRVIMASLSDSDVESTVFLPSKLNDMEIEVGLYKKPDNLIIINSSENHKQIAKAFLPVIDAVIISNANGRNITINKTGNKITLIKE